MELTDINLINEILARVKKYEPDPSLKNFKEFVFDKDILSKLKSLLKDLANSSIYTHGDNVKDIWLALIDKSIKCLRYFDNREPYQKENKLPVTYGIGSIKNYFEKYTEFESLLYGASHKYRDHVIHSFRTWMTGIFILLDSSLSGSEKTILDQIVFDGIDNIEKQEPLEKISMWTIIALCHDLGYPLEKSKQIMNKTKEMMEFFIPNSQLTVDTHFTGTQDIINEYIIKLMSSKMVNPKDTKLYSGRVQPKYYIKFTKSLEHFDHGIISAIVLYKSLLYFLESDFNINEDYYFSKDDANQFFIRREILRAITSHTCTDVYHIKSVTLSLLLIICDELQEWNRKSFSDLYIGQNKIQHRVFLKKYGNTNIETKEELSGISKDNVTLTVEQYYKQYMYYTKIFRDGQDTVQREFTFEKTIDIICDGRTIQCTMSIPKDTCGTFSILPANDAKDLFKDIEKNFEKKYKIQENNNEYFLTNKEGVYD
jgi:hypothetical protein